MKRIIDIWKSDTQLTLDVTWYYIGIVAQWKTRLPQKQNFAGSSPADPIMPKWSLAQFETDYDIDKT